MEASNLELSNVWLASRYQLVGVRAEGSFSVVYQGLDAVLQRPVAVKVVPPQFQGAYKATLELTASLAHPAFLSLYDVIDQDDKLFLVYEFIDGRPLADYLLEGLPSRRGLSITLQVARALAYAHARDVSHGDLTPHAILVDRSAVARLANIGLPPDDEYLRMIAASATLSGIGANSDLTMEALRVDPRRQDVWAAASLLWLISTDEVTSGESVSKDPGSGGVVRRDFRSDAPEDLKVIVERALNVDHPLGITSALGLVQALSTVEQAFEESAANEEMETPLALRALRDLRDIRSRSVGPGMPSEHPGTTWRHDGDAFEGSARIAAYTPTDPLPLEGFQIPSVGARVSERPETNAPLWRRPSEPRTEGTLGARSQALESGRHTDSDTWASSQMMTQPAQSGMNIWIWSLIALALFAIFFLAGFLLLPAVKMF